jgi:hypothetical protein
MALVVFILYTSHEGGRVIHHLSISRLRSALSFPSSVTTYGSKWDAKRNTIRRDFCDLYTTVTPQHQYVQKHESSSQFALENCSDKDTKLYHSAVSEGGGEGIKAGRRSWTHRHKYALDRFQFKR